MKELREFKCGCCGVDYEIELEHHEPSPFGCESCRHHLHARTAPELLRQRKDHTELWNANLDDMRDRITDAENRTRSVYHTRGLALEILNKINAAHDMRPDGTCTCGVKACRVGPLIGGNRLLSQIVRAYDAREQRRLREISKRNFWDSADEWDEFIEPDVVNPPAPESRHDADAG